MGAILRYIEENGISADLTNLYPFHSKRAWITQIPKEFDFEHSHLPTQLFHAGLISSPEDEIETGFPWHLLTGEPLIYISMGTMVNGSAERLRLVTQAAQGNGRQVVVSMGPHLHRAELGYLAANTITVSYAPQIKLFKYANLCITHGGLNTVLESLYEGVPLVVLPIIFDQPGVAARVAFFGVGDFLNAEKLDRDSLCQMIERVLSDPAYRRAAQRMQTKIAWQNGAQRAARHLHEMW